MKLKKGIVVRYPNVVGEEEEGIFAGYEADASYCYVHTNKLYGHCIVGGVEVADLKVVYRSKLDYGLGIPKRERIRYYSAKGYAYDRDT